MLCLLPNTAFPTLAELLLDISHKLNVTAKINSSTPTIRRHLWCEVINYNEDLQTKAPTFNIFGKSSDLKTKKK